MPRRLIALAFVLAGANTAARAALNVQHVLGHDYDLTTD